MTYHRIHEDDLLATLERVRAGATPESLIRALWAEPPMVGEPLRAHLSQQEIDAIRGFAQAHPAGVQFDNATLLALISTLDLAVQVRDGMLDARDARISDLERKLLEISAPGVYRTAE